MKVRFNKKYLLSADNYYDFFLKDYVFQWKKYLRVPAVYVTQKNDDQVELSAFDKEGELINSYAWAPSGVLVEYNKENHEQLKQELRKLMKADAHEEGMSLREYIEAYSEED